MQGRRTFVQTCFLRDLSGDQGLLYELVFKVPFTVANKDLWKRVQSWIGIAMLQELRQLGIALGTPRRQQVPAPAEALGETLQPLVHPMTPASGPQSQSHVARSETPGR